MGKTKSLGSFHPLNLLVVLSLALSLGFSQRASSLVVATNADVNAMTAAAEASSSAGYFGAIRIVHNSGAVDYASATFLTDPGGNLLPVAPAPSYGVVVNFSGYGTFAYQNGAYLGQTGTPLLGTAPNAFVFDSLGGYPVNSAYYGMTRFVPGYQGLTNAVQASPGDSGGRVSTGDNASTIGILTGANLTTDEGSSTVYSLIDIPEVLSWEQQYMKPGQIWALTARHCAVDASDPVTLTNVYLSDWNNPTTTYNVVETIPYPTSGADWNAVDWQHPDLALVQLQLAPEPASLIWAALACFAAFARRGARRITAA